MGENLFEKLGGIVSQLKAKEGVFNPILLVAMSFLSDVIYMAAAQQQSEEGQKLVRVAARTIMNLEWKLRKSVDESPTPYDNKILDEFIEACRQIEPGYVPVA